MRTRVALVGSVALLSGLLVAPVVAEPPPGPQPSFATFPGTVTARPGAIERQPDGKYVVAGVVTAGKLSKFAVARFNADGTPDTSFGTDGSGTVVTEVGLAGKDSVASDVRILPDGTIVAGGYAYWYKDAEYPAVGTGNNPVFALVGYTPQGVPDPAFGATYVGPGHQDGVVLVEVMRNDRITALALDGSDIIATGPVKAQDPPGKMFGLAAFRGDGSLDTSFGDQGTITTRFAGTAQDNVPLDVFVGASGEIVVVGSDSGGATPTANFAVAKFTRDGDVHQESKTIIDIDGRFNAAYGGELMPDGTIVIAGLTADASTLDVGMVMARLKPDLKVDTGFGNGGWTVTHVPLWKQSVLQTVEAQSDGGLIGGGFVSSGDTGPVDWALTRYTADGQRDPAFGTAGVVTSPVGEPVADGVSNDGFFGAVDVLTDPDGSSVATGAAIAAPGLRPTFAIQRYLTSSVMYSGPVEGLHGMWTVKADVVAPAPCRTGTVVFTTTAGQASGALVAGSATAQVPVSLGADRVSVRFVPTAAGCLGSSSSTGVQGLAPQPVPPPTPVVKQRPLRALNLPTKLWRSGRTMLLEMPVRTNAGQRAKVWVRGSGLESQAMGEARVNARVFKRNGRVYVWLSGKVPTRITVKVHAPAVPGFTAFTVKRTYRTKPA